MYQNCAQRRSEFVAQSVERLLPTPEVRGSNPVIGELLFRTFVYRLTTALIRRKYEKRGREWTVF